MVLKHPGNCEEVPYMDCHSRVNQLLANKWLTVSQVVKQLMDDWLTTDSWLTVGGGELFTVTRRFSLHYTSFEVKCRHSFRKVETCKSLVQSWQDNNNSLPYLIPSFFYSFLSCVYLEWIIYSWLFVLLKTYSAQWNVLL